MNNKFFSFLIFSCVFNSFEFVFGNYSDEKMYVLNLSKETQSIINKIENMDLTEEKVEEVLSFLQNCEISERKTQQGLQLLKFLSQHAHHGMFCSKTEESLGENCGKICQFIKTEDFAKKLNEEILEKAKNHNLFKKIKKAICINQ